MTSPSVLIVEDEIDILENLSAFLESKGVRVLQARSVEEAESLLGTEVPALIFLDILLPGKRGDTLLSFLKERHLGIPVIVFTNTDSIGMREHCMRLGAKEYIIKSNISLHDTYNILQKHIG